MKTRGANSKLDQDLGKSDGSVSKLLPVSETAIKGTFINGSELATVTKKRGRSINIGQVIPALLQVQNINHMEANSTPAITASHVGNAQQNLSAGWVKMFPINGSQNKYGLYVNQHASVYGLVEVEKFDGRRLTFRKSELREIPYLPKGTWVTVHRGEFLPLEEGALAEEYRGDSVVNVSFGGITSLVPATSVALDKILVDSFAFIPQDNGHAVPGQEARVEQRVGRLNKKLVVDNINKRYKRRRKACTICKMLWSRLFFKKMKCCTKTICKSCNKKWKELGHADCVYCRQIC